MEHFNVPEQNAPNKTIYNCLETQKVFKTAMLNSAQYLTNDGYLFKNINGQFIGYPAIQQPDLSWGWKK